MLKQFTVLDLKDASSCIPFLIKISFVLEWPNTDSGQMQQYTWTVLPQGVGDSTHLFTQALGKELRERNLKRGVLL